MLINAQEVWPHPHVSKLRNQQPEALAREIELPTASVALLFEEALFMQVDQYNEETEREVRKLFVDLINFLNLVSHVLERLELRFTFWTDSLLCMCECKCFNSPSRLNPSYKLDLICECESHD